MKIPWTGYQLESAATLVTGTVWENVTTPPAVIGDVQVVTVDIGSGPQFFRLRNHEPNAIGQGLEGRTLRVPIFPSVSIWGSWNSAL